MNFHMEGECTWWAYVLLTERIGNHRVNLVDHFVQGACVAGVEVSICDFHSHPKQLV